MQTIIRPQPNIHPIFDEFDRLYTVLSEKHLDNTLVKPVFNECFTPLIQLFKDNGFDGSIETACKPFKAAKLARKRKKTIIVCFSGGKDSIATILHYKKQGYKVYLYHLTHINPPLFDEYQRAEEIAKYLNCPIYIDTIKLSGKHDYIEHPMKNMIIANGAIQYGIREGIGCNIAFGNYYTSTLEEDNFEFCAGDDKELWEIYEGILRHVYPTFKMGIVLANISETLETVCPEKELMEMSVSCLCRAGMRNHWHEWVKTKWNMNLPKYRCGRCYKCCLEYIYMADHDLQEYSEGYYEYCLHNLEMNWYKETGIKHTPEEIWNHFMFYSMEESKYYG